MLLLLLRKESAKVYRRCQLAHIDVAIHRNRQQLNSNEQL